MNPKKLIQLKANGETISGAELEVFISAYVNGKISDDDMISFLKAVHTNGMTDEEIIALTEVMLNSGEQIEFSDMDSYIADKHSTGGVGDKVSLILAPLMAAAGLAIPMIAGRSLGHTGGTIDKLETIPGFQTRLEIQEFKTIVENHGVCIMAQTEKICPADRKIYSLRDVTGIIDSIPLICGSIMSKKIAEGIQGLVLDIKTGNGAFMNTLERAVSLGEMLQKVGEGFGLKTDVIYSSMNEPLGQTAGMGCEIQESIDALHGDGNKDLMDVVFELGSKLLVQAGFTRLEGDTVPIMENLIESGKAYQKFEEMVTAQGGDLSNLVKQNQPLYEVTVPAGIAGYIESMDTLNIGWACVELGCGRRKRDDLLDATAGIEFFSKTGDKVNIGDPLFRCFNSNNNKLNSAIKYLKDSIVIGPNIVNPKLFFSA